MTKYKLLNTKYQHLQYLSTQQIIQITKINILLFQLVSDLYQSIYILYKQSYQPIQNAKVSKINKFKLKKDNILLVHKIIHSDMLQYDIRSLQTIYFDLQSKLKTIIKYLNNSFGMNLQQIHQLITNIKQQIKQDSSPQCLNYLTTKQGNNNNKLDNSNNIKQSNNNNNIYNIYTITKITGYDYLKALQFYVLRQYKQLQMYNMMKDMVMRWIYQKSRLLQKKQLNLLYENPNKIYNQDQKKQINNKKKQIINQNKQNTKKQNKNVYNKDNQLSLCSTNNNQFSITSNQSSMINNNNQLSINNNNQLSITNNNNQINHNNNNQSYQSYLYNNNYHYQSNSSSTIQQQTFLQIQHQTKVKTSFNLLTQLSITPSNSIENLNHLCCLSYIYQFSFISSNQFQSNKRIHNLIIIPYQQTFTDLQTPIKQAVSALLNNNGGYVFIGFNKIYQYYIPSCPKIFDQKAINLIKPLIQQWTNSSVFPKRQNIQNKQINIIQARFIPIYNRRNMINSNNRVSKYDNRYNCANEGQFICRIKVIPDNITKLTIHSLNDKFFDINNQTQSYHQIKDQIIQINNNNIINNNIINNNNNNQLINIENNTNIIINKQHNNKQHNNKQNNNKQNNNKQNNNKQNNNKQNNNKQNNKDNQFNQLNQDNTNKIIIKKTDLIYKKLRQKFDHYGPYKESKTSLTNNQHKHTPLFKYNHPKIITHLGKCTDAQQGSFPNQKYNHLINNIITIDQSISKKKNNTQQKIIQNKKKQSFTTINNNQINQQQKQQFKHVNLIVLENKQIKTACQKHLSDKKVQFKIIKLQGGLKKLSKQTYLIYHHKKYDQMNAYLQQFKKQYNSNKKIILISAQKSVYVDGIMKLQQLQKIKQLFNKEFPQVKQKISYIQQKSKDNNKSYLRAQTKQVGIYLYFILSQLQLKPKIKNVPQNLQDTMIQLQQMIRKKQQQSQQSSMYKNKGNNYNNYNSNNNTYNKNIPNYNNQNYQNQNYQNHNYNQNINNNSLYYNQGYSQAQVYNQNYNQGYIQGYNQGQLYNQANTYNQGHTYNQQQNNLNMHNSNQIVGQNQIVYKQGQSLRVQNKQITANVQNNQIQLDPILQQWRIYFISQFNRLCTLNPYMNRQLIYVNFITYYMAHPDYSFYFNQLKPLLDIDLFRN